MQESFTPNCNLPALFDQQCQDERIQHFGASHSSIKVLYNRLPVSNAQAFQNSATACADSPMWVSVPHHTYCHQSERGEWFGIKLLSVLFHCTRGKRSYTTYLAEHNDNRTGLNYTDTTQCRYHLRSCHIHPWTIFCACWTERGQTFPIQIKGGGGHYLWKRHFCPDR